MPRGIFGFFGATAGPPHAGPSEVSYPRTPAEYFHQEKGAVDRGARRAHLLGMSPEHAPSRPRPALPRPEWRITPGLTDYDEAVAFMEARARAIAAGEAGELIWLVEHPPLYTAGTSAKPQDLVDPDRFPVYEARRGGQYTYHGPGQRVVYVMLDVGARGRDVRAFVERLEAWVIAALGEFNIRGEIRPGRVGVWVERPEKAPLADGRPREDKIAAIGIRLHRWVSFHGISINVDPALDHFTGIVPCGITGHGVTSLVDLGLPVTMDDLDLALGRTFDPVFGDSRPG